MQRKTTKLVSFLIVLAFLFSSHTLRGQNLEQASLTTVLKVLETQYQVSFSFVPSELKNKMVIAPAKNLSLDEAITYLNQNTPFLFSKIDDRYISVSTNGSGPEPFCGVILDQDTGLPLEGANVAVSSSTYGTTTNRDGVFFLPRIHANQQFSIQYLGYSSYNAPIAALDSNCPTILLRPGYSELNEILIQNFLVQGISKNFDGSTALKTENFGLLPGQTENDVLQMAQVIPGVESINETISTINTRGGSNDENLILWEGNRMFQTGHFFGLISAFNPYLTQDVRIYKNGTPARYGESVSGVIDIRTSDSITKKLQGGAGVNLIHANAFLEVPISEKLGLQVSGRGSSNEYFKTPVYNNYAKRIFQDSEVSNVSSSQTMVDISTDESFNFFDAGMKVLWDPTKKDQVRFNFITMNNDLDFTETLVDQPQSKTSKLNQRSAAGGASWNRQWSERFTTSAHVFTSYYLLEALNTDIFTNQLITQENEVLELGAKINAAYRIHPNFSWNSGYEFNEIGISNLQDVNVPRFRDFEKDVLRTHVLHSSLGFQSNSQMSRLTLGIRGNYFNKFDILLWEPRVHFLQQITKGLSAEVAGEVRSQTANQRVDFESDFLGIEKRRWVLANNEDIPIKKSKQGSFGLVYNRYNWFVQVEGFYKYVQGITSKSQGFQNQFRFENIVGDYHVKGVEFILNKKVNQFSGWISYTYNKNDYNFESLTPSEFPNNIDVRHAGKVALSYDRNALKLAAGLNWRTGKPFTTPVDGQEFTFDEETPVLLFNTPNEQRLPDYFRLDFSAEYVWNISEKLDLQCNLSLLNVLDKKNTLNVRYVLETNEMETSVKRIEERSLGFTPNFSVQVFF